MALADFVAPAVSLDIIGCFVVDRRARTGRDRPIRFEKRANVTTIHAILVKALARSIRPTAMAEKCSHQRVPPEPLGLCAGTRVRTWRP